MKTIALIDTHRGGHHLTYLRFFSKSLLELGYRVMTFCPDPPELDEWIAYNCPKQAQLFHAFEVQEPQPSRFPIIGRLPQPFTVLERWRHAAATIQSASSKIGHSPDLVFFAWIDSYLSHYLTHHIVDLVFHYSWSGLYFQPCLQVNGQFLPVRSCIIGHYAVFQSSHCRAAALLNEDVAEELQSKIRNPVITFPDVTDESAPDINFPVAKQIRERAKGRKVIGLLGSLNKRKGLMTLLEASQQANAEDWLFVFAGPFFEQGFLPQELIRIQSIVKADPSNCLFHFESVPDGPPFNALINECDILFAAYEGFPYSSNLLTKAAVLKKPIVVSKAFCMGKRVEQFKLGVTISEGNVSECLEALRYLCQQPELNNYQLQPNYDEYKRLHSTEQLSNVFHTILETL